MTMKVLVLVLSLGAVLARPDVSHLHNAGYQYNKPTNSYGVPIDQRHGDSSSHQHHHVPTGSYLPAGLQVPLADSHVNFLGGGSGLSGSGSSSSGIGHREYGFNNQLIQDQKHVYYYAAPDEEEHAHLRIHIAPNNQKNTNVIFVKAPSYGPVIPEVIAPQSQAEEKTKVFVLVKQPEQPGAISIQAPAPVKTKPEVYVVKYNNQHEAEQAISGGRGGHPLGTHVHQLGDERAFIHSLQSDSSHNIPHNDKYSGFDGNVDAFAQKAVLYGQPTVRTFGVRGNFGGDDSSSAGSGNVGFSSSGKGSTFDLGSSGVSSGSGNSFDLGSSGAQGGGGSVGFSSSGKGSSFDLGSSGVSSGSGNSFDLGSSGAQGGSGSVGFSSSGKGSSFDLGSSGVSSGSGNTFDLGSSGAQGGSGSVGFSSSGKGSTFDFGSSGSSSPQGSFSGSVQTDSGKGTTFDLGSGSRGSSILGSTSSGSSSPSGSSEITISSSSSGTGLGPQIGSSLDTLKISGDSGNTEGGNFGTRGNFVGGEGSSVSSSFPSSDSTKSGGSFTSTFDVTGSGNNQGKEYSSPVLDALKTGSQGTGSSFEISSSKSSDFGSGLGARLGDSSADFGSSSSGSYSVNSGHVGHATYGPPGLSGPY